MWFLFYGKDMFCVYKLAGLLTKRTPTGVRYVEMMGFLGAGNNPMVGMTVSVAVATEEAIKG